MDHGNLDRNSRPEGFPSILVGEAQTVPDEGLERTRSQVFTDVHIWQAETGLVQSKNIAGAIRNALEDMVWNVDGYHVADLYIANSWFLRDPGGQHSHGVITLQAIMVRKP